MQYSNEPSAVYFGCDGTFKARIKKVNCTMNGLPCSEEAVWDRHYEEVKEKMRQCLGSADDIKGQTLAECDYKMPKSCNDKDDKFWDLADTKARICKRAGREVPNTFLLRSKDCTSFSCESKWGPWINVTSKPAPPAECNRRFYPYGYIDGLKFCRHVQSKCVIVETSRVFCDGEKVMAKDVEDSWKKELPNCESEKQEDIQG